jgi:hypothetical protein
MTFGEKRLECEVLALFDQQADMLLARMQRASAKAAADLAHTLVGSARGVGAWKVAAAAQGLELAARGSDPTRVAAARRALARTGSMSAQSPNRCTGITARVLGDMNVLATRTAKIILAAAVFDDVLGMVVLAVVAGSASSAGVQWLHLLTQLRLGACLADDMGLGKTIQVLSLLLVLKEQAGDRHKPSLLVAPASLLANWAAEIARFAPSMKAILAHPSAPPADRLKMDGSDDLADVDLVITSYGFLTRTPWLTTMPWRLLVLDEAQAIKNAGSESAKAARLLRGEHRLALSDCFACGKQPAIPA